MRFSQASSLAACVATAVQFCALADAVSALAAETSALAEEEELLARGRDENNLQREDCALDGRHEGVELEHSPRLVALALTDVEAVLEQAVHDAPDAERRLHDRRRVVAPGHVLGLLGDLDHGLGHLEPAAAGGLTDVFAK